MTGIATGLIVAAITAMINIKIRYAPSEAQAKRSVALIFWKIIYGISLFFVALVLIKELSSSEPLTRSSLITILLCCFCLFQAVIFYFFQLVYRILERNHTLLEMGGHVDRKLIDIIGTLPCQIKQTTSSSSEGNKLPNTA
jgi:hypothetical protein